MNLFRFPFRNAVFTLVLCLVAAAWTCLAQTPGGGGAGPSGSTIGYTVVPGANTAIYLRTIPNATCKLRESSGDDQGDEDDFDAEDSAAQGQVGDNGGSRRRPLKLFSDADGNARFFVEPPPGSSHDDATLALRCVAPGARGKYFIKLRASDRATANMPFPPATDPALNQSNQTVLPALDNAANLTDQDIMLAGYPVRPDPTQSPDEYALWLKAVSQPINVVTGQATPSPNVWHGLLASGNWSGYVLEPQADQYGFAQPYVFVFGHWNVPKTVSGELFRQSSVSEWVGLDGNSASPLVQAGTQQDVLPAALVQIRLGQPWTLSSYNAWTEVFPLQPSQVLPTLPVHPGDDIECAVWISWDTLIPTQPGGFAYFQLFNVTTNQIVRTIFEIANLPNFDYKFNFLGHDAEWIVERPSFDRHRRRRCQRILRTTTRCARTIPTRITSRCCCARRWRGRRSAPINTISSRTSSSPTIRLRCSAETSCRFRPRRRTIPSAIRGSTSTKAG